MKNIFIVTLCLLSTSMLFAQKKEWKQMENFHSIMSKSFHPIDKGNYQPLKENVDSLVMVAKEWQSSTPPAGYDQKAIKPKLDKLVKDCAALQGAVTQKKNNETLKKLITSAHSTFHEIMEKGEDGEHK